MKENSKRRILIVSAIAIVVVIIVVAAIVVNGSGSKNNLRDQLDLAEQYLSDLDYEQAIAAYEQALEIDPKCEEAYLALADIYVTLEDYDKAFEILNEGYEQTGAESITKKIEEIQDLLAEQENTLEEVSEEKIKEEPETEIEEESEQETFFSEEELEDTVYVDYTFDLSRFNVSIFGKQMYEWTAEELRQYLIDNNIYDMSKETASIDSSTGEVIANEFHVDGVNYGASRGLYNGTEWMGIVDSRYDLILSYGDNADDVLQLSYDTFYSDEWSADEYDEVLNISENVIGKSLVELFGDEEFVTAIKNNTMPREVYGNNIKVTMIQYQDATNIYEVDIYLDSLACSLNVTFFDDKIDNIYTNRF
jgi:tetratricopeptide (TPR) repeat protein